MASSGAAAILMHMQGRPADMQLNPAYRDVTDDVMAFLRQRLEAARDAGIPPDRILLDPGIGFGKALEHNLQLLGNLPRLAQLRQPLVVGVSRKSFIGHITGQSQPAQRIFGTAASVAWCAANGAAIVRVHDVKAMSDVVRTIRAIQAGHLPDNSP
jgi:dihydropteroate synthase